MSARPKHMQVMTLREQLRRLRKHAPLRAPVYIVRMKDPRCDGERVLGYMSTRRKWPSNRLIRFRLVLEARLPDGERFDALNHEWAHGLDCGTRVRSKDRHDSRWGQCYARAWRAAMTGDGE